MIYSLFSAHSFGGVFYSHVSSDTQSLYSTKCIFERNSAGEMSGVFRIIGPHDFYSEQNVFMGNTAATGTILAASSIHINVVITSCSITTNRANAAIIYAGEVANIHISDTEFMNNTSEGPTVYVTNSVNSFTCVRCIFWQNTAEVEGIMSISYADRIFFEYLEVQENDVTIGSMIMIKTSVNTTILSSFFEDNLCSDLPCAISVKKAENVKIEDFLLVNDKSATNMIAQAKTKQGALDIDAKNIVLENVYFKGLPGYVYKGISAERLFFRNVTYDCPESHFHSKNIKSLQLSSHDLENDTTLALQCMQCAEDYYRFGLPSLTFREISDLYNQYADGTCYKCPPGGLCDGRNVVALPNYWGFLYQDKLDFVFCQPGFCCEAGSCATYDGCSEGREGKACTSCIDGFQLGIEEDICIPSNNCVESWFYVTMFITGILYLGFLVLKVEFFNIIQQMYINIRDLLKRRKNKNESQYSMTITSNGKINESQSVPNSEIANSIFDERHKDGWVIPFDHVEIFHILVFHLQDTRLFKITLPGMPSSSIQLDQYKDTVLSLFKFDSIAMSSGHACFQPGWTQLNKLLVKTSIIPVMILVLLFCILILKLTRLRGEYKNRLMSSAYTVFLLVVLFSSQLLSSYSLNFVTCERFGSEDYLFIDTTVKCYQLWQFLVFCYIGLCILPFWLTLFLGPGLLATGKISIRAFLFGLLFPAPFVLYCVRLIWKERKKEISASCQDLTTTVVLSEVWDSFTPFPSSRFLCWGGIVEIRRLTLVFCACLIGSSITKLLCMITVVALASVIHATFRPYADPVANACANISLGAQVMVGVLNFGWATFQYSGSNFVYGDAMMIGQNLVTFESVLIQLFPIGAVLFCIGYFLVVNLVTRM